MQVLCVPQGRLSAWVVPGEAFQPSSPQNSLITLRWPGVTQERMDFLGWTCPGQQPGHYAGDSDTCLGRWPEPPSSAFPPED